MFTQIKDFIKRIIQSILFKYMIAFLLSMVITIVLGINFYIFWVVVIGFLSGIFGVFVPIVEKIADKMKYEIPPFLENLSLDVKRGIIIVCFGILAGSIFVFLAKQEPKKISDSSNNSEEENFEITVLNDVEYSVNVGEIISININIRTPESYKYETTPFILYSGYFDEEQRMWVQFGSYRIGAGEENYCLHIDTELLGLPTGSYMISLDLFKSSDYSEGKSLDSANILLNLSGEAVYYIGDIFDRNVITYEKITDIFVINGVAYEYNTEELVLDNVENDDLEKISMCKHLKFLQITGDNLTDLNLLAHLYSLESLHISSKNLEDITSIGGLVNLKKLSIGGSQVNGMGFSGKLTDITPIENLVNLETLSISDCQVEDIKALRKLSKLKMLWIYKTPVKDISPLEGLVMLEDLRLHSNNISNISVLENLKRLEYLTLTGNPIVDEQLVRLKECLPNCDILFR